METDISYDPSTQTLNAVFKKSQNTVREFFYYSDYDKPNRVTVCGIYVGGIIRFNAARLSDTDRFVRKIGRAKARGRAISNPIVTLPAAEDKVIKTFNEKAKEIAAKVRLTPAFQKQEYLFTFT